MTAISNYFRTLAEEFGRGWNRFWFTPSDPFPLCALRVVVGLAACYWLLSFTSDLAELFAPDGLLAVDRVQQWRGGRGFSILDYANHPALLWGVHAAAVVIFALFTVGLFTRLTSILTLVLTLSYIWRGPMLAAEAEAVLVVLLAYLCLGPCGAYLSLDAWRRNRQGPSPSAPRRQLVTAQGRLSSAATVTLRLMQVHLTMIYAVMALAKCRGAVWWQGEAVWWMAARPESRLVDLTWLSAYPDLIAAWTHAIVAFEFLFALLIWNRLARPLLLVGSIALWGGLMLLTGSVLFGMLMVFANLAFVPAGTLRSWCRCNLTAERPAAVDLTGRKPPVTAVSPH